MFELCPAQTTLRVGSDLRNGAAHLIAGLLRNNATLKELDLSGAGSAISTDSIVEIASTLAPEGLRPEGYRHVHSSVTALDLTGCDLTDERAYGGLSTLLEYNSSLKSLMMDAIQLPIHELRFKSSIRACADLARPPSEGSITLNGIQSRAPTRAITPTAAYMLGTALRLNQGLKELDLQLMLFLPADRADSVNRILRSVSSVHLKTLNLNGLGVGAHILASVIARVDDQMSHSDAPQERGEHRPKPLVSNHSSKPALNSSRSKSALTSSRVGVGKTRAGSPRSKASTMESVSESSRRPNASGSTAAGAKAARQVGRRASVTATSTDVSRLASSKDSMQSQRGIKGKNKALWTQSTSSAAPKGPPIRERVSVLTRIKGDLNVHDDEPALVAPMTQLFETISMLSSLERLSLNANDLRLSVGNLELLGCLVKLEHLHLRDNLLDTLPSNFSQLQALKVLDLQGNRIAEWPAFLDTAPFGSLVSLNLKDNRLNYLPPSVNAVQSLRTLDLARNQLKELPHTISSLKYLTVLNVKDNPLNKPPLSVAQQGLERIKEYFHALQAGGSETSCSARLVFVGDAEAGKTTIQQGLRFGHSRQAYADQRTIALDVHAMTIGKTRQQVHLSLWDMAGQVEYAPVLQVYLRPGSLYLLAISAVAVKAELDGGLAYERILGRWLENLQVSAPRSWVMIVLTKCDKICAKSGYKAIQEESRQLVEWVQTRVEEFEQLMPPEGRLIFDREPGSKRPRVIAMTAVGTVGDESLKVLKDRLEEVINLESPPVFLPNLGCPVPHSWQLARRWLYALRDGHILVRESSLGDGEVLKEAEMPTKPQRPLRAHTLLSEARIEWAHDLKELWAPKRLHEPLPAKPQQVLDEALGMLVGEGEMFVTDDLIHLDPSYIINLLKPILDHKLDAAKWRADIQSRQRILNVDTRLSPQLASAVVALVGRAPGKVSGGELREELLPHMWASLNLQPKLYSSVLRMLCASGVLILDGDDSCGRRCALCDSNSHSLIRHNATH